MSSQKAKNNVALMTSMITDISYSMKIISYACSFVVCLYKWHAEMMSLFLITVTNS